MNIENIEICSISKEDLSDAGYNVDKISDSDFREIARRMSDLIMEDYWVYLREVCNYLKIPEV